MQVIPQFFALLTITAFLSVASAHEEKGAAKKAFKTCFKEQGIERGERPNKEQKEKLEACIVKEGIAPEKIAEMKAKRKAFREARKECAMNNEDRAKIKACLKDKGFSRKKKA